MTDPFKNLQQWGNQNSPSSGGSTAAPTPTTTTGSAQTQGQTATQVANLTTIVSQMVAYQKKVWGTIDALNAYQKAHGGSTFSSWDDVTRHYMTGSPVVQSILSGKLSMASWQQQTQGYAMTIPTSAASQGKGPAGGSTQQRDAYATLLDTLNQFGLGNLASWLWGEVTKDTPASQVMIDLRNTDAYKQRFPGMAARQAAGLPAINESQYIQNEEDYRRILTAAGEDPSKFSKPADMVPFFQKDLSVDEVNNRADMWNLLTKSPQTAARVRGLFEQFTGIGNVSDDQLFQMLVEDNSKMLQGLNTGLQGKGVQTLSLDNLKGQIQKAISTEAATFAGGGGQTAQGQNRPGYAAPDSEFG